jgi:hypothetical protein
MLDAPVLDFRITAAAPVESEHGPRDPAEFYELPPGVASCEEWATRLIAGEPLPFPRRTGLCFPALAAAAGAAPPPQLPAPVDDWLGRAWANLRTAVETTGATIGRTVGTAVGTATGSAVTAAAPDWSGAGRVLLFAGIGLAALYLLTPTRRRRNPPWIAGAVRHPGAFAAKARRAGLPTLAFARTRRHAPGRLGRQARLALTLDRLRRRRHG